MTMPDGVPQGPWHPTARLVAPLTPADLGLDSDIVAHALHHLSPYGDLTPAAAAQALGSWSRRDELESEDVLEVLRYYRPTRPVVALPPHLPGLLPLVDPALREVA
ncbi:hypothetical protein [Verrucosispora sp. WMMD1129]|uniref:hypothetical protein n=1 Tax=Verrucosispora sp. WMMD1129 TaxID=3016093 RepID=UPI00249CC1DB|nr:hypothetical protein [Verrucosispora sp. WMMD1129]WFE45337.1 hypothetical protein O7624_13730 [Verrucosispora sp. WMMD1129]